MTDLDQPAEAASVPPSISQHQVRFNGNASEYFKIWIVNIALTILTLGIYSAWAKVRTRKYLYGNTELAGARFDYHADPVKILKGRLIVGALFVGYALGGKAENTAGAKRFIEFLLLPASAIVMSQLTHQASCNKAVESSPKLISGLKPSYLRTIPLERVRLADAKLVERAKSIR